MDSDFINTQTDKMTNGIFLTYDFLGRQEILLVRRRESLFSWTRVLKGKRYCHLPFVYFLLSQERMYPSPACWVMKCPHSILSPNESLISGMDLNKRQNAGAVLSSTRSDGSEIGLVLDDVNDVTTFWMGSRKKWEQSVRVYSFYTFWITKKAGLFFVWYGVLMMGQFLKTTMDKGKTVQSHFSGS